MEFGTGVMTITPWHSQIDFEIAQRHRLEYEQIIDLYGKLLPIAGPDFTGMKIKEARQRIETARSQARGLLTKADPFTEPVVGKGDKKLFRARFAGLDRDQAEAVCRTLKRSDISCITIKN